MRVLDGVTLDIRPGEFVGITGPSGSGKTTLLNLAALLDLPTSGEVAFGGHNVASLDAASLNRLRAARISMVFQNFRLLGRRTVMENVAFRFRYLDRPHAEILSRSEDALRRVAMLDHARQPVRLLSGGEMQRVAIARAIAIEPDLLLVDEPTGNLDAAAADRIMRIFQELNAQGTTMVLVTHNPKLSDGCTRHLCCEGGRLHEGAR